MTHLQQAEALQSLYAPVGWRLRPWHKAHCPLTVLPAESSLRIGALTDSVCVPRSTRYNPIQGDCNTDGAQVISGSHEECMGAM